MASMVPYDRYGRQIRRSFPFDDFFEDDEEETELPPNHEHLAPVERLAGGVDGTDIQAQHRCREEQSP